ncbi:metallophosphoesterase [Flammeovirgaceae bacterium 311]|nr:metallophosphoesterase [Flammeovirgaceae bacterium 311]
MLEVNLLRFLVLVILLAGCDNPFEYHPNEIILDESEKNLTQKHLQRLGSKNAGDTIRLLLMGDTQRFYDHTKDFYASASKQQNIDFMLHCGDISDFGMAQEFKWVHGILERLPFPYLTVVGNHDLLANGRKVYKQMFGPLNYHFDFAGVRFILIDANSREYQYNGKVPDIGWLKTALAPETVEQAVVISHIPPFDADFDPALEMAYVQALEDSKKVRLSLHGHQHRSSIRQPYGENLSVVVTNSMKGRSYYIVMIWKEGHDVQEVVY